MRRTTSRWAWTYFIQSQSAPHLVKIGTTTTTPKARLLTLQVGSPTQLKLLWAVKGIQCLEQYLHEAFKPIHVHGEWFKPAPDLGAFIKALKSVELSTVTVEAFDEYFAPLLSDRPDVVADFHRTVDFAFRSAFHQYPWKKDVELNPIKQMLATHVEVDRPLDQEAREYLDRTSDLPDLWSR